MIIKWKRFIYDFVSPVENSLYRNEMYDWPNGHGIVMIIVVAVAVVGSIVIK